MHKYTGNKLCYMQFEELLSDESAYSARNPTK